MLCHLGPAITLQDLLLKPSHSLLEQSWAPRHQTHGIMNADGFGVGWYDRTRRPEPAVYRSDQPMWNDRSFASIAGMISSSAVLAAVRSATPGLPVGIEGAHPFTAGRWLFAHNGAIEGWRDGIGEELRALVSAPNAARIEVNTDSAVLFGLVLDRLHTGLEPNVALADVVQTVKECAGGRMNLMLTDGERVAATTFGASLFTRQTAGSVVVASEPFDDDRAWNQVPDVHTIAGDRNGVTTEAM